MSQQSVRPLNPVPEEFAGASFSRGLKRAFHATRPKFYPASVLPVLAGTAWGAWAGASFDLTVFLLALFATVAVHAASNVLNDVGDDALGTDAANEDRIYPYTGGSRFIQTGILEKQAMARVGITLLTLAAVAGLALFALRGPTVFVFGLVGVALCVLYSLGPVKLASLGLGETAVAVGLGVLPVTGAAWLQGAAVDLPLLLFSLPVSAWVAAILLINEVPDMQPDGKCGKLTLPVRLGLDATAVLYFGIHVSAAIAVLALTVMGRLPLLAPLAPIGLLVLAWRASAAIRKGIADRPAMTQAIEGTLAIHTIGCAWLTGCALFAIWW